MASRALTDADRALLALEQRLPRHSGAKESAIRDQLDLSAVRYYQLLHQLVQRTDVIEEFPQLSSRVLRLHRARMEARARREMIA